MTAIEAYYWVIAEMEADPDDRNPIDEDDLLAAWIALHGREPDEEDTEQGVCGLWTDCVNQVRDV